MNKAEKDIAERIYPRYAITLTNPLTIDEFVPDGKFNYKDDLIYEHRRLDLDEQFSRIRASQLKSMDMSEPYDIGFANAISLLMYIKTGFLPDFIPKPASVSIATDQFLSKIDKLKAENDKLVQKQEKLSKEAKELAQNLDDNIAAKEVAIKALETKHAKELAKAKAEIKLAAPEPVPSEPVVDEPKSKAKSKWSLTKK